LNEHYTNEILMACLIRNKIRLQTLSSVILKSKNADIISEFKMFKSFCGLNVQLILA